MAADIEALTQLRTRFGGRTSQRKAAALRRCADAAPRSGRYRELLQFIAAHPDDATVHRLAEAELDRLRSITDDVVEAPFSVDLAEWLAERFPGRADVAWQDGSAGDRLDEFLAMCISGVEHDGLLDHGLTTRQWFDLARGNGGVSDLGWLIRRIRALPAPPALIDSVFESLDLSVRWRLDESAADPRFPKRSIHYVRSPLQRAVDLPKLIRQPLPPVRPLPVAAARQLIDVARSTLAARGRETDPVTYANPREVMLVRLPHGVDVGLFGLAPGRRLPLESFFGYVAARNRLPVAYGGAWVFFDRAEIGINIFDAFRGGESAWLFGQIMRVYHHCFGVRRFRVDPFQFGAGNEEAIKTGAFWFYYRLGFRPAEPELAALADAEFKSLQGKRGRKTKPSVLRRLATGHLVLDLSRPGTPAPPDPVRLGLAVTRAIGERFSGDLPAARRWARRRLTRLTGTGSTDDLALLFAQIPDLQDWPARDRKTLGSVIRAKDHASGERDYARRLGSHARLRAALGVIGV